MKSFTISETTHQEPVAVLEGGRRPRSRHGLSSLHVSSQLRLSARPPDQDIGLETLAFNQQKLFIVRNSDQDRRDEGRCVVRYTQEGSGSLCSSQSIVIPATGRPFLQPCKSKPIVSQRAWDLLPAAAMCSPCSSGKLFSLQLQPRVLDDHLDFFAFGKRFVISDLEFRLNPVLATCSASPLHLWSAIWR